MTMVSVTAYDLLNVIVEGEVTVHVLRLGLVDRGFSNSTVNEVLLGCLIELCEAKAIRCYAEASYGQPQRDDVQLCQSAAELVSAWTALFGTQGPTEDQVSSSTMSVETTECGAGIAVDDKYDIYLPFLKDLCGWPDED